MDGRDEDGGQLRWPLEMVGRFIQQLDEWTAGVLLSCGRVWHALVAADELQHVMDGYMYDLTKVQLVDDLWKLHVYQILTIDF